jgi:hypothetical protein
VQKSLPAEMNLPFLLCDFAKSGEYSPSNAPSHFHFWGDQTEEKPYAQFMAEGMPLIELRVSLSEPPELYDLVAAFAAVGHLFDAYIAKQHPGMNGHARLFVKEIRQGSTIIDLIPDIPGLLATMNAMLIVDDFMTRTGELFGFFSRGHLPENLDKDEAKNFLDTVRLIAKDNKGSAALSSAKYRDGKTKTSIEFSFTTPEARVARELLERKVIENEAPVLEKFEDKLMVFWQSNKGSPKTGKPSGERAIIESLHKKPLGIKYDSELAKERIKHEATEDERNVFKKGFYVDGYVERSDGKPVAYRIIALRDVIDLPDDDE